LSYNDVKRIAEGIKRDEMWSKLHRVALVPKDSLAADVLEEKFKRPDIYIIHFETESTREALSAIELIVMVIYEVEGLKASLK
jgi:hypothetical protein